MNKRCVGCGNLLGKCDECESVSRSREAKYRQALEDVLAVCQDWRALVLTAPRALAKAEQIVKKALEEE